MKKLVFIVFPFLLFSCGADDHAVTPAPALSSACADPLSPDSIAVTDSTIHGIIIEQKRTHSLYLIREKNSPRDTIFLHRDSLKTASVNSDTAQINGKGKPEILFRLRTQSLRLSSPGGETENVHLVVFDPDSKKILLSCPIETYKRSWSNSVSGQRTETREAARLSIAAENGKIILSEKIKTANASFPVAPGTFLLKGDTLLRQ